MNRPIQIALIGDVHRQFDQHDITRFNQSDYEFLLCTGDLANLWHWQGLVAARQVAKLQKPTLIVPGNHDTLPLPQLVAESKQLPLWVRRWLAWGQPFRLWQWRRALGKVQVGGYSVHLVPRVEDLAVVVGRPFAMGGSVLHCQPQLRRQFGISTMAESAAKLCQLIEQTPQQRLIFLAHNGPTGLGSSQDSIWGKDFQSPADDYGDSDLREAIDFAWQQGKTVLAVLAGHMHHHIKQGGHRTWHVVQNGIHFINAARVPRIFEENGRTIHHHIRLTILDDDVTVTEKLDAD
ncbi:metallophosphoesterase [Candidatus Leptofilum sp.]|uniref:metallophosphoesterase n=1 Tax=Candidatus Leptofilum sp. TaxID=3241576 RepID=UPI003B59F2A2